MAWAKVVRVSGRCKAGFREFQGRGLIFFIESLRIAPKGEKKVCQILVASIHKSFTESRAVFRQGVGDQLATGSVFERPRVGVHRAGESRYTFVALQGGVGLGSRQEHQGHLD